jgi:branched-chain amino acid transport system substrate-binding protein
MKHFTLATVIICTVLSVVPPISAEPQASLPLRFGATLPLTGDIAPYGTLIRDGIELAVSDLKTRGIDVAMSYEDVPSPGPIAVTAIRKLISENKIQGLAGNFWNPAIPIMAPAILQNKVVAFHTAAADDLILAAGDLIISTNTKIRDEAAHVAEYAYQALHARTACVLYIGTTFGENYKKHFADRFVELGGTIAYSELTSLGDSDHRGVLTKVKNSPCNVFFAAYFGTNLGLVLKQAQSVGVKKTTLSVYEAEDPSVIEVAGEAAEGLKFFVAEPVSDNDVTTSFKDRFAKRFGYAPRILASNAYDATTILALKFSQCQGDSECAKKKIYEIHDYVGVSGTFSIDPDGAAQKPFVLKTVKSGRFVRVAGL